MASGIDWDAFWAGNGPNEIRTVLEVLRLYPGWGLLAGGAADIINTKQDFEAIKGEDAPWIEGALAVRSAVMIVNNGVGHLVYVTELIQDLATASVVGAELDALTASVNEALLTVKVGLDGAQFLLDFGLVCGAKYRSMTAAPGSPSQGKWDGMVANYEANILGDLVGGVFDVMDLSSAGFANAGPVKAGAKAAKGVFDTAKLVKGLVKSVLQGWFGVWGSKGFEKAAPGGGLGRVAEQQAADVMLTELAVMKSCYIVGDTIIAVAAGLVAQQIAELNAAATVALGGKDPFITARDAAVQGLDTMQARIGELAEMEVMASTASEKTEAVTAFADRVLGLLDAIVVPEIEVPKADIGDDAVSDAAEGLLDLGGRGGRCRGEPAHRSAQRGDRRGEGHHPAADGGPEGQRRGHREVLPGRHRRGAEPDPGGPGEGGRHRREARQVQLLRGRGQPDHRPDLRDGRVPLGLRDRRHPQDLDRHRPRDRRRRSCGPRRCATGARRRSRCSRTTMRAPARGGGRGRSGAGRRRRWRRRRRRR